MSAETQAFAQASHAETTSNENKHPSEAIENASVDESEYRGRDDVQDDDEQRR
jgi:hypothetical protein